MFFDAGNKNNIGWPNSEKVLHKRIEPPQNDKHGNKNSKEAEAQEHNKILWGYLFCRKGKDLFGYGKLLKGVPPQSYTQFRHSFQRIVACGSKKIFLANCEGFTVQ